MKKFCALVILTLSFAVTTYADCADDGHMGCPGISTPALLPIIKKEEADCPALKEMAVSLLQSILALS